MNPVNGTILDTLVVDGFLQNNLEVEFLPGISSSNNCAEEKFLIQPFILRDTSADAPSFPDFHPFGILKYDLLQNTYDLVCSEEHRITDGQRQTYDAATWETHRQTCEVRLDLDADNRRGRAGPHYQSFSICTDSYPLADGDTEIWTADDRPIDSLTVRINDFGPDGSATPELRYLDMDGFTVLNQADTLLRIYPDDATVAVDYPAWTTFIQEVWLKIPLPRPEGYRITEIFLHAGGLTSDGARSFIYARPDFFPAGRDSTIYVCRNNTALPFNALPDAFSGGRWEPELGQNAQNDPFFNNNVHPFGEYTYITDFEGCTPDTAVVTILPRPEPQLAFPNQNDTVYICEGETYIFDPASRPNVIFYYYNDFFPESYREISEPTTVAAFIGYTDALTGNNIVPCIETVSLTVLDTTAIALSFNLDTTICAGDTLQLAGFSFFEAGQFSFTAGGNGCDTFYDLTLNLQEEVNAEVSFFLCPGDSVFFSGQFYDLPGSYELASAGPGCDTIYQIEILLAEVPTVNLDTSICPGQILQIGNEQFDAAGNYGFSVPAADETSCDTAYSLQLTISPLNQINIDTLLQEGQTLQAPGIFITAPIDTVYQWPGQNGDCDTIVKLVVDYVSSTNALTLAATNGYRIRNPLRAGEPFRLWKVDQSAIPIPAQWEDLQFFSAWGQSVGATTAANGHLIKDLPPGLYYYRLRTTDDSKWISGKLLIIR